MAQIICKDLSIGYNGKEILKNINFQIDPGDYICIVGENGAGKTTMLKVILGLKEKMGGEIIFGDGLSKTGIGYLPQRLDAQKDFPASVTEVVLSGCQNQMGRRPFYGKSEKDEAAANIERLGLTDLKKRSYRDLSGGQQQRVLIARALSASHKMLVLDEPAGSLDPKMTEELYGILAEINRKDGITVIMVSHDVDASLKYSNKVLHLGRRPFFGSTDDYMKSDQFLMLKGGDDDERNES